jgi:membrane-associated phospholipid phosphatase
VKALNDNAKGLLPIIGQGAHDFVGRIPKAAVTAARSPYVWAPTAGAAAIFATGIDDDLSDWASSATPLFGSQRNAAKVSDNLRDACKLSHYATVGLGLLYIRDKQTLQYPVRGVLAGYAGATFSGMVTGYTKTQTNRPRPNEGNYRSFPSGHTSTASVHGMMASQNLEFLPIPAVQRRILQGGLALMSAGTGWARVEAKAHYPTDVLIGFALGNFAGIFVSELLIGNHDKNRLTVSVGPSSKSVSVGIAGEF